MSFWDAFVISLRRLHVEVSLTPVDSFKRRFESSDRAAHDKTCSDQPYHCQGPHRLMRLPHTAEIHFTLNRKGSYCSTPDQTRHHRLAFSMTPMTAASPAQRPACSSIREPRGPSHAVVNTQLQLGLIHEGQGFKSHAVTWLKPVLC